MLSSLAQHPFLIVNTHVENLIVSSQAEATHAAAKDVS